MDFLLAKLAANRPSVLCRQPDVQDDQAIVRFLRVIETGLAVMGNVYKIALLPQALRDQSRRVLIIFNQKQPHFAFPIYLALVADFGERYRMRGQSDLREPNETGPHHVLYACLPPPPRCEVCHWTPGRV